jgi:DNA-binding transcriptional MerR regulator
MIALFLDNRVVGLCVEMRWNETQGDFMAKSSGGNSGGNMTLTEVSKRTGISMPTLQKYKKRYPDRIPSVGKGRTQRYPEESLKVFGTLREENMARRGRPRKNAAAPASGTTRRRGKPARRGRPRKTSSGGEGLLTLTQIAQRTKISYPTLLRYVKTSLDRIPHVGTGRRRRFKPEAVAVFQQLRASSRSGRRPGTTTARRGRPPATGARRGRPPGRKTAARRGRPPGKRRAAAKRSAPPSGLSSLLKALEKRLKSLEKEIRKPFKFVRG